jgi:hypothetical protein
VLDRLACFHLVVGDDGTRVRFEFVVDGFGDREHHFDHFG